jgi:periplasmic protein TonB
LQASLRKGIIEPLASPAAGMIVAVPFEDYSCKAVAVGAIAIAHALAIYGLVVMAPAVKSVMVNSPLLVRFVALSEPQRQWQPPPVDVIVPPVQTTLPVIPPIETAITPEVTERAITVAVQSVPTPAARQDDGEPKLISAVEYVREPSPRYPPQSRRLKEQGLVVLRVLIDEKGNASSIEIENSSGYVRLDHAAREAVFRATFRPYVEDGAPRRALVLIPIEFALNRSAA